MIYNDAFAFIGVVSFLVIFTLFIIFLNETNIFPKTGIQKMFFVILAIMFLISGNYLSKFFAFINE